MERYVFFRSLGTGVNGEVFLGFEKGAPQPLCIKQFRIERSRFAPHEAEILKILHDISGIPEFVSLVETKTGPFLITKYLPGKELLEYARCDPLDTAQPTKFVLDLAEQIVRTLAKIHERGYAHRDVKLENIIVSPTGTVFSLIDFDSCSNTFENRVGTRGYVSPEIVEIYSQYLFHQVPIPVTPEIYQSGDLFALGVTLYVLLEGSEPFPSTDDILHYYDYQKPYGFRFCRNSKIQNIIQDLMCGNHTAKELLKRWNL